jgi:Ser/Thr protein kinase RdoA (MazF antagonist)
LSEAEWPPPWTQPMVERVLATMDQVAATAPPPWVPPLESLGRELAGWHRVADRPDEFLGLRLCSREWLDSALPSLVGAEGAANLAGDSLMHVDVRSDNICFAGDRTILVDWNSACVGNPVVDVAFWLPSLALEGGPLPSEILRDQPEIAAMVAGFFACRAGLPPIPTAPRVRQIQLAQLRAALPWAAEVLGLPPPEPSIPR